METIGYMLRARSTQFHWSYTEPWIDFDATLFPTADAALGMCRQLQKHCTDMDWCFVEVRN